MTRDELIAEITSGGFSQYDEAGLIDYISLKSWIKSELKRFGNNLMIESEEVLHVKNSRAKLPDNFWQLNVAVRCDLSHYESDDVENVLQNSLFFKERLEESRTWNNASGSYDTKDVKYIREDYYFRKSKATFYYDNPKYLKLTKGFNRSICTPNALNLDKRLRRDSKYEINIVGDYINTNFTKGTIYIQYNGIPSDEEGKIIIPETQHNRLKEYLIYYCRSRILEDLISGDDDANKINLLSYYDQKQRLAFGLAMTESKMEGLGVGWITRLRNKSRLQTLKYESMLPRR